MLCVLLPAVAAAGCRSDSQGSGGTDGAGGGGRSTGPAAAGGEWAWLQATRKALEDKRRQLAALEAGSGSPSAGSPGSSGSAGSNPAQQAAALHAEVERQTAQLGMRLVAFINSQPPVDGRPLSAVQRAALRMKSDEDILLARDYVEQGGDYRRAIEIYEAALAIDPGYHLLRSELAAARRLRYMTRDRFDQVKEGMPGEEVRRRLGAPNLHNVRSYPDREVEAWFYPKNASGAAAAVWFRTTTDGADSIEGTVYEADFDAVAPPAPPAPSPRPAPAPRPPAPPGAAPPP